MTFWSPVHEATPWINSFVLVEGKDKLGNLKLMNLLMDPNNLTKVIVREPYHFKTSGGHCSFVYRCLYFVCVHDCKKCYCHQELDEASPFLKTFNTELGRFWYTVMPFGATVAWDVSQCKLDQCFGKIKQVIVIAGDIMIVGQEAKQQSTMIKHWQPCLKLLRKCNLWNWAMRSCNLRSKKWIMWWNIHHKWSQAR